MSNYVYIATSIDGYIAKKDGDISWLMEVPNSEGNDFGYSKFIEKIDAIIMGRKTFEKVLTFGDWVYSKKVFVLSNTLSQVPEKLLGKVEFKKGEVENIIEELNKKGYKNLYIDGGKTIQSFLKKDLIDEMIITRIPIILGNGISLFGEMEKEIKFDHIETEVLCDFLVKTTYQKRVKN